MEDKMTDQDNNETTPPNTEPAPDQAPDERRKDVLGEKPLRPIRWYDSKWMHPFSDPVTDRRTHPWGRRASDHFQWLRVFTMLGLIGAAASVIGLIFMYSNFDYRLRSMENTIPPTVRGITQKFTSYNKEMAAFNKFIVKFQEEQGISSRDDRAMAAVIRTQITGPLEMIEQIAADSSYSEEVRHTARETADKLLDLLEQLELKNKEDGAAMDSSGRSTEEPVVSDDGGGFR